MKKLIVTLMLAGATLSSFAGILENRKTGETIEFNLNRQTREVEVLSTSSVIDNRIIDLKSIRKTRSKVRLYAFGNNVCAAWILQDHDINSTEAYELGVGDAALCLLVPIYNVPTLLGAAIDTIILPIKAPIKLIQNMKRKKDFRILMRAINGTEVVEVSDKRFQRIEQLLK